MLSVSLRNDCFSHVQCGRILLLDLDADFLGCLSAIAFGHDTDLCLADSCRLKSKLHDFVSLLFETYLRFALSGNGHRPFSLDPDRRFLEPVFQGEDIDRHRDLLPVRNLSWKSRQHHQRRLDRDCLFGIAVGCLPGGDNHDPHASYVHRKPESVGGCSGSQSERTCESDYRIEPVVLPAVHCQGFVSTYAEHRRESSAVGPDDIIVEIPGLHSERLSLVHRFPRVRSLE